MKEIKDPNTSGFSIKVEEPSEKSVVVKRVADNPEAYLIRRDVRKCFKNFEDNTYATKDSRLKLHNNAPAEE